jgi:hypothetical protein
MKRHDLLSHLMAHDCVLLREGGSQARTGEAPFQGTMKSATTWKSRFAVILAFRNQKSYNTMAHMDVAYKAAQHRLTPRHGEVCINSGKGRFSMKRIWTGAILAGLLLSGCDYLPFGQTPLKEIVATPAQFEGKEVRVRGKVKDVTKIPLIDLSMYVVDDGSGEMTVIAHDTLPAVNDTVKVRGVVESAAIVGGQSIGLRIKETKRY